MPTRASSRRSCSAPVLRRRPSGGIPTGMTGPLAVLLVALALAGGATSSGARGPFDLEGRAVSPLDDDVAATVLLFTRTDCPISNRYAPEVRRLHDRFA